MEQTANIEALLNIMANGIEIAGLAGGFPSLILCFIPFAAGLRGYTSKIAIASVCMIIVGFAFPGVINLLVSSSGDAHNGVGVIVALIISAIVSLAILATSIAMYFLPTIIAYREGSTTKNCNDNLQRPWIYSFSMAWCLHLGLPAGKSTATIGKVDLAYNTYTASEHGLCFVFGVARLRLITRHLLSWRNTGHC